MRPLCQYCREALAGLEDLAVLDLSHNMINKVDRLGFRSFLKQPKEFKLSWIKALAFLINLNNLSSPTAVGSSPRLVVD